jgi:diacylglycerol kinase (ATP)
MSDRPSAAGSGETPRKSGGGWRRIWNAFLYSLAGLADALRNETAFRQEALLAALLIPATFFLPATGIGRALLIGSVVLVLIIELVNSAVEAVVDRASPENHPLAKRAKDFGSAAVFLALVNVPVVWTLVLFG